MAGYSAGIDVGSVATKAVVTPLGEACVIGRAEVGTGPRPRAAARDALVAACEQAGVEPGRLCALGATGYGRYLPEEATFAATEVMCQARGVHALAPCPCTIIDIGGQDSKVILVDPDGYPTDFVLNDRCAAGTGRFLEVMAAALQVTVDELGRLGEAADEPCHISSTCTVFAESEVVGLLAGGQSRECVAAGLCQAIARQVLALAARLPPQQPVVLVGGVARNAGVRRALGQQLGSEVIVPPFPAFTAALGAALLAAEEVQPADG